MPSTHAFCAALRMLLLSLLAAAFHSPLQAQEQDSAAAQALFDEARSLMVEQNYAAACLKLAESQRLDPGIGTLFHLAVCYEHEGKIASAWAAFLEVASMATATRQDQRAQAATRRAALLEPRLPKLRVSVPAASRTAGIELTRDGNVVGQAQWSVALPVDPGVHLLEVTAAGKRAYATSLDAREGSTVSLEVPVLEAALPAWDVRDAQPAAASAPTPTEAAAAAPAAQPAPARVEGESKASAGPGALALGLGAGGIVAIGAGSVLGILAKNANGDSTRYCAVPNHCAAEGVRLRDRAFVFSDLATVGFAVGGAALVAAGIAWALHTRPAATRDALTVALGASTAGARVAVMGEF